MKKSRGSITTEANGLRGQAEKLLREKIKRTAPSPGSEDTKRLIHELQVHQVELELQNEELMQARQEVERQLDKYSELYNFSPAGYFILDSKGTIRDVNLTGATLLFSERSRLLGRRFGVLISRESLSTFTAFFTKLCEGAVPDSCTILIPHEGGQPRYLQLDGKMMNSEWAKGQQFSVVAADITGQKEAEHKLAKTEALLSKTFASMTAAIIVSDSATGKISTCNNASKTLFGYREEEFKDFHVKFLYEKPEKFWRELSLSLSKDGTLVNELLFRRKDGSLFLGGQTVTEILDESGRRINIVCMVRDITDRKRMEEELRVYRDRLELLVTERTSELTVSNKLLQQKIGEHIVMGEELARSQERLRNLATSLRDAREKERAFLSRELHDGLGQVLTGMKMDIRWIEKQLPKNSKLLMERLSATIKLIDAAILNVQHISSALRPPSLKDFGINETIQLTLQNLEKKTHIAFEFIASPSTIDLEERTATDVFRILQESLTNIIRHADAKHVTILIQKRRDNLMLKISDDGKGITKKDLTDHRSIGLTGMRERAYAMGGSLTIIGTKGQGTTVSLKIPLTKRETMKRGLKMAPEEA